MGDTLRPEDDLRQHDVDVLRGVVKNRPLVGMDRVCVMDLADTIERIIAARRSVERGERNEALEDVAKMLTRRINQVGRTGLRSMEVEISLAEADAIIEAASERGERNEALERIIVHMGRKLGAEFMDPPDGGDVSVAEQVERLIDAYLALKSSPLLRSDVLDWPTVVQIAQSVGDVLDPFVAREDHVSRERITYAIVQAYRAASPLLRGAPGEVTEAGEVRALDLLSAEFHVHENAEDALTRARMLLPRLTAALASRGAPENEETK